MRLVIICSCLLLATLAALVTPASGQMLLRSRVTTTTALPARKERLPYTPVRGSTRQERLPYTPVKPTTQRPSLGGRILTTTTKRVPFPVKTTTKPCNCNCNIAGDYKPVCAGDGTDKDTFANTCQLNCYNCTLNKRYRVIKEGECSR